MTAEVLLKASALRKTFRLRAGFAGKASAIAAVDGVDLGLKPGEALGLVGESASGKTTLARLLIGLIAADSGEVLVAGRRWDSGTAEQQRQLRRRVQYVFQNPMASLNPRLTVEETLREPLLIHRLAQGAELDSRIDALLASVQLPADYRNRLPRQLSGGERQRVGIARALATAPDALICDEPIASLDVSVGVKILQLLKHIHQQQGTALLFISHDLRAVAFLCERIAVMQRGRLVEEGPAAQITANPQQPYTQLLLRSARLDLDAA